MKRAPNVIGQRFGRLTAGDAILKKGKRATFWHIKCLCDCGKESEPRYQYLVSGHTKSCGCLNREKLLAASTTHGGSKHDTEYHIWASIIARCENKNHEAFHRYGGRGIKVCERWRNSYAAFREDVGARPVGHSLDRYPDQNGNYEPGNVRWATSVQQNNNRRDNTILEFNGKRQTIADWGRELGIRLATLRQRYSAYGWSVEKTLTTPVRPVTR